MQGKHWEEALQEQEECGVACTVKTKTSSESEEPAFVHGSVTTREGK